MIVVVVGVVVVVVFKDKAIVSLTFNYFKLQGRNRRLADMLAKLVEYIYIFVIIICCKMLRVFLGLPKKH